MHRLGIAQHPHTAVRPLHRLSFGGNKRINRRNNGHVRAELAVIPYRYLRIVLNSKVKIEKTVLSYAGMTAVVKGDRSKEKASVANFPDKLGNDSLALLPVALVKLIEITAQIMGFFATSSSSSG